MSYAPIHKEGEVVTVKVLVFQPPWEGLPLKKTLQKAKIIKSKTSPPSLGLPGMGGYDIVWVEGPKRGKEDWIEWADIEGDYEIASKAARKA